MNKLSQVGLGGGGGSEAGRAARGGADLFYGWREGVAEDHGSPGAEEVEVTVAVLVIEPRAFGMGEERGLAADGTEGADGRVDSAGKYRLGFLLQKVGACMGERHLVKYRSVRRRDDSGRKDEDHWPSGPAV